MATIASNAILKHNVIKFPHKIRSLVILTFLYLVLLNLRYGQYICHSINFADLIPLELLSRNNRC